MIKLFEPSVDFRENEEVLDVLQSGTLARGLKVEEFERELASRLGKEHAVALSNGSSALHLSVRSMGWKEGDKIFTSPYSFIAVPNSLLYEKCQPVFGDVDYDLQLTPESTVDALERDTDIKGVILPHMLGKDACLEKWQDVLDIHPEVSVIEDASQTFAPREYGLSVGKIGSAVIYSFHQNKIITTGGEGGGLVTNDPAVAERARSEREHGLMRHPDWQNKISIGFNYRMTELQAAVGVAQLEKLDDVLRRREDLAQRYTERLQDNANIYLPAMDRKSWFGFYIEAEDESLIPGVSFALAKNNIEFKVNPFPVLPHFRHIRELVGDDVAKRYNKLARRAARIILLPLHPNLRQTDVDYICEVIDDAITTS
ncbi:DegT/DnrJ/EryC1/StrS aminotransferase family protein [Candidatus Saccharibacteria bacterium]|nr:DegT/DnrJ/EryC1/StrS aminotransferase family protein [Candidatus Saccharibacteria bacterium]